MSTVICLTHDVDSVRRPLAHVLSRRARFRLRDLLAHVFGLTNLYDNFKLIMEVEESLGVRSTWFIPCFLFPIEDIEDYVRELVRGGWEVGLHVVVEPVQTRGLLSMQKEFFKEYLSLTPVGARIHGLKATPRIMEHLTALGFRYDSSLRFEECGREKPFRVTPKLWELPLHLMDADIFGRLKLGERSAWRYITWKLDKLAKSGVEPIVVLFHQESFRMRGGRLYARLLEWIKERGWKTYTCAKYLEERCGLKRLERLSSVRERRDA